jgi:hypothetical protein
MGAPYAGDDDENLRDVSARAAPGFVSRAARFDRALSYRGESSDRPSSASMYRTRTRTATTVSRD